MASAELTVCNGPAGAPGVAEVESLYFAAFNAEPLCESRATSAQFSRLYGFLVSRADLVSVFTRAPHSGELVGLAYGHPWRWAEQTDDWAAQLRDRLGDAASGLEGRFAVYLLAVHPDYRGHGLGRQLLRSLLGAAGNERAWLITRDEPTAAMALYTADGWRPVGHGPDTPNKRPGLVLTAG
ncbi:MAG TPA: GNAT family N-acetyltransferase [Streptosporangiaceae bacterium]|nr:GNAT family N-acetyltransferase [Streptosporangiaceae bacterium]